MTRFITFASIALLGLATAISCTKESPLQEDTIAPAASQEEVSQEGGSRQEGFVAFRFTAEVETPATRVSAGEEGSAINYAWQDGDEIAVLYDGGSTTATADVVNDVATFSPSIPEGVSTLWMVYPSDLGATLDDGRLKIDMPAVQKDNLPAFFVASCDASDVAVVFRHPTAWYKLVVDGDGVDVTRMSLTSAGGNNLTASALTLDFDESGIPSVYAAESGAASLTQDFDGAGTWYIPVVPDVAKASSDLSFQFYRGEDKSEKAGAYKHAKALDDARSSLVNWGSLPAKATNRYVSTSGSASNNGATADKAWNIAQLRTFLGRTDLSLYDGVNIRIAAGTYTLDAASYFTPKVSIKLNIVGAAASTTVINANSKTTPIDLTDASYTGMLTFKNLTFRNATQTNNGAVIRANSSAKANFEGCIFSGNSISTSDHGGGVFNAWGSAVLNFKDCSFMDNSGYTYGGVAYVQGNTEFNFENCTFTGNHSTSGGVFYIAGSARLTCVGCTFGDGTDIGANSAGSGGGGVFVSTNSQTHSFTECLFNYNKATGNWGSCLYLYGAKGRLKIDRCLFKKNVAASRGVIAANVDPTGVDNAHLIYVNASSFVGNTVTAGDGYGSVIHGNGGTSVCLNNVTTNGNFNSNASPTKNNWTLNLDGSWLIVNSTFVDRGYQHVLRANLTGSPSVALCNNIVVQYSGLQDYPIWIRNNGTITDNGHNVRGGTSTGNITSDTDKFSVTKDMLAGSWAESWDASSKYGVYNWSGPLDDFTPAPQSDVEETITGFSHSAAGVTHVGRDFYDWLTNIGVLGKDARGVTRGTPWWPGSYQAE